MGRGGQGSKQEWIPALTPTPWNLPALAGGGVNGAGIRRGYWPCLLEPPFGTEIQRWARDG